MKVEMSWGCPRRKSGNVRMNRHVVITEMRARNLDQREHCGPNISQDAAVSMSTGEPFLGVGARTKQTIDRATLHAPESSAFRQRAEQQVSRHPARDEQFWNTSNYA